MLAHGCRPAASFSAALLTAWWHWKVPWQPAAAVRPGRRSSWAGRAAMCTQASLRAHAVMLDESHVQLVNSRQCCGQHYVSGSQCRVQHWSIYIRRRRGCAGGCAAAAAVCECVGGTGISWPRCSARPWHGRFTHKPRRRPWSSGLRVRAAVGPPAPGGSSAAPAAGDTSKTELHDRQLTLEPAYGSVVESFTS